MAMVVLKMYAAQFWGDSNKIYPACFYFAMKSGNDRIMYGTGIGKSMESRDLSVNRLVKEKTASGSGKKSEIQNGNGQKENGKPAKIFLLKPLLEEKPQHSFYRPAA